MKEGFSYNSCDIPDLPQVVVGGHFSIYFKNIHNTFNVNNYRRPSTKSQYCFVGKKEAV